VVFSLSLAVIALYVVPILTDIAPLGVFNVTIWVAVAAAITAITSLVFHIIVRDDTNFVPTFVVYLLFAMTIALLVIQTGGNISQFITLWMLVAFFSGIFAIWGALPVLLATGIFVATKYLSNDFTANVVAAVILSSLLPMLISLFLWRSKGDSEADTRSVKSLTTKLSEVASKSEIVINAIGDGVVAIDSQGTIELINPAAQQILGWGKQDALALNYKSILQMTDLQNKELDPLADPILQVLNTNQQIRSNMLVIKTRSGKKVISSLVVSPIGDAGSGIIAVFRDMTKEKAEGQEQAEFISTASHEMRTPVASIEGYLGLALNPATAQIDDKARDFIMKAHDAAQHLGHLFQDLLDVAKSEDGRMSSVPKVVDIVPFAETITQGLGQKAADKNLVLSFKPTANQGLRTITPVYFVNQDNDHIREILDNLIENAIKYTPNGEVVVDVTGTDEKVIISVKDSGLGIPTEDIAHLFQKFYRVDNPDRQQIGGTGLGLYLSRRLAEAMQGRLYLESVHGKGSTFFLELPRVSNDEAEQLKIQQATQAAAAAQQAAMTAQAIGAAPVAPTMMPPVVAPSPIASPLQPAVPPTAQPVQPTAAPAVKAATTVPRGESLSREQIAEHVRKLEAMIRANSTVAPRPPEGPTQPPAQPPTQGQA